MRHRVIEWLRAGDQPAVRRDVDMMALTVCVVLLAALTAGSDHEPHSKLDVLAVVWATTVGLVLTHCFALYLAVRLVRDPAYTVDLRMLLGLQLGIVLVIASTSSLVVLLTTADFDRFGARATAALFLGLIVAVESRRGGASGGRAVTWGLGAAVIGLAIATAKWVVG